MTPVAWRSLRTCASHGGHGHGQSKELRHHIGDNFSTRPGKGNYGKPREAWGCIPTLQVGDRDVTDNREKAQAFMDAFFPSMAPAKEE